MTVIFDSIAPGAGFINRSNRTLPRPHRGKFRPHRYRRLGVSLHQMTAEADQLTDKLPILRELWQKQVLSDAEAAALYLILYLQARYLHGPTWLVGPGQITQTDLTWTFEPFINLSLDHRLDRFFTRPWDLGKAVATMTLRGVPLRARQALSQWLAGQRSLRLTDQIPSAREMLAIQLSGSRYVSACFCPDQLTTVVHDGRDALSLFLHDLVHASEFRPETSMGQSQMVFYRMLSTALSGAAFDDQTRDSKFLEDLEYIVGDLNTHPVHSLLCLWIAGRNHFLRRQGLTEQDQLPSQGHREYCDWRFRLYKLWQIDEKTQQAAEALAGRPEEVAKDILNQYFLSASQSLEPTNT